MNLIYRAGWAGFRLLFSTYFRWRVFNPERVPATGPVILAGNHSSFLDPPLIGAGVRREIHFLARSSLFRFPGMGALLRNWNAVPLEREGGSGAGLRVILNRLSAGQGIVVFPEGTRSRDGRLQTAQAGVGLVIVKSTAPVVPVRVFGTFEAMGRHHCLPRPCPVAVKYGMPTTFDPWRKEAPTCSRIRLKEIYKQATDELMRRIAELKPWADRDAFP